MTAENKSWKMAVAIEASIKVMENRFGRPNGRHQAVDALKGSIQIDVCKPPLRS